MYSTRNNPDAVEGVLKLLKERIQRKYSEAAERQTAGKKPSGHMNGLTEALLEVDNLLHECSVLKIPGGVPTMSILEYQTDIGHGMKLQVWFNRAGGNHTRSEVYLFDEGYVVAYQDCVNGVNSPLYMSSKFKTLTEGEPAFDVILAYAGVLDPNKIELYTLEG